MQTGGCLCGAIRFQIDTDDISSAKCYCRDCQYVSGGEPAAVVRVPCNSLKVDGEPKEYRSKADSGAEVFRSFCPQCGTPLFAGHENFADYINIKVGALDDPTTFKAQILVWPESAQPWHTVDGSIPHITRH